MRRPPIAAMLLVGLTLVVAAGCDRGAGDSQDPRATTEAPVGSRPEFPPAPAVPPGPPAPATAAGAATLVASFGASIDSAAIAALGASGDPRYAWVLADVLRFAPPGGGLAGDLEDALERLTDLELGGPGSWGMAVDNLIAWDTPAPPGYLADKRALYRAVDGRWDGLFADSAGAVDWRHVGWGGVFIDDRRPGDPRPCRRGCIPALDDPAVTNADGGDWYPDDAIVFGLVVGGTARAYPKNIMEVHEMVNDTIAGRRVGIPYCTLCGSAQAYFLDLVPAGVAPPVLRTSGLLIRSNKMTYDLTSGSLIDTFTGEATSGPLRAAGVALDQTAVVASSWGDWKRAHPATTIVARDGGIGRSYPADPLGGRDDAGPIFPIGDTDPRLPVQEPVLGVVTGDGTAIAFPAGAARLWLEGGGEVQLGGVRLVADAGGLRARSASGADLASHESFWFAWSQFHPDTALWSPPRG